MADRAKAKRLAKEQMKCNKPKKTPDHKTKSHVVKACKDGEEKIIRFGQQGVKGAGKILKLQKRKLVRPLTTQGMMLRTQSQTKCLLAIGATKLNGDLT